MTRGRVVLAIVAAMAIPRLAAAQYKGQHTGVLLIDHPGARPGQYVENISEEAYGALSHVAYLLSNSDGLRVARTSQGGIVENYGVDACSLPTSDEKQQEKNRVCRQALEAKRKAWMTFLRARADLDGSGFVTDEEAAAVFREVMMAFRVTKLQIDTPGDLLAILDYRNQTEASVLSTLAAYTKLRKQALEASLDGMPELPAALSRAVRVATASAP
jgi:hypothetical protein